MQENSNKRTYINDQEIDLMALAAKLWKGRTTLIKWCIYGAIIGLVAGFSIPKTYSAKVAFVPETQQQAASNVSSIASMMGININSSVDAISVEMFPDVIKSTPFIVDMFDLPVTFSRGGDEITVPLVEYMKDYQKMPWWSYIFKAPFKALKWGLSLLSGKEKDVVQGKLDPTNLPEEEREVVKFFVEKPHISIDKKSGKISMSLSLQDPLVVAEVMNAMTENLKKYISDYRTSKARQDVENLEAICRQRKEDYHKAQQSYATYADANKNVIRQSAQAERERLQQEMNLAYQVYSQVATQLEAARIQAEQDKPAFTIIEPVSVPIRKDAPSKVKLMIAFAFLAVCCAAAWRLFGEDMWKEFRKF